MAVFVSYPGVVPLPFAGRMFDDPEQAISRRQLFTEALHRGLGGLFHGPPQARQELYAWAAAWAAPLYAWARSLGSETLEALRAMDEIREHRRREDPEWDAAVRAARLSSPTYGVIV
jgi:hypothetical protein